MAKEITKLADHPEMREVDALVARLSTKCTAIQLEISSANTKHNSKSAGEDDPRVAAVLEGKDVPPAWQSVDLAPLYDQLNVVSRALAKAKANRDELVARLSSKFCDERKPALRSLVRTARDQIVSLQKTAAEIANFQGEIEDAGITYMLPVAKLVALGDPHDSTSRVAYWLREMETAGLL